MSNIPSVSNLIELLLWRAEHQPNKVAYIFLENGEEDSFRLTYSELHSQAKIVAAHLQNLAMGGERALLLYNSGIEFIVAFFGCLYAQVIPVPLYPPRRNQNLLRLQSVVRDADAKLALTTLPILQNIQLHLAETPELKSLIWLTSDQETGISHFKYFGQDRGLNAIVSKLDYCLKTNNNQDLLSKFSYHSNLTEDSLAFLQYTSGSTGNPKGVMVSHGNLLVNAQDIDLGLGYTSESISLSWLPVFHDMGLIGAVIHPLYRGIQCYMMEPVFFLQSPFRWLKAICRYGATHSGGPNFGYELCYRKIKEEQLEEAKLQEDFDLSKWQMAFNGAETVRADVIDRFCQKFAPYGFNSLAFCPGYGMAETTLKVSGVRMKEKYKVIKVKNSGLQNNQVLLATNDDESAISLVACGQTEIDTAIKIVNPKTLTECSVNEVGEIWVAGKTVAQGYWNDKIKTQATFNAYLADTREGPFLRTGDLGFVREEELFVTGRLKDTIVIRGKNHYPQDIEQTVENSHEAIIFSHTSAFTLKIDEEEKLIIIAEVERRYRNRRKRVSSPPVEGQERRTKGDRRQNNNPVDQFFAPDLTNRPIFEDIVANIRSNVARNHGLKVDQIVLIRFGTIPKTSSGKIQRYACRQALLKGDLNIVFDSNEMKEQNQY